MILFFRFSFFQSDRPTHYQETHSTVNEKNKGGWPYFLSVRNSYRASSGKREINHLCYEEEHPGVSLRDL